MQVNKVSVFLDPRFKFSLNMNERNKCKEFLIDFNFKYGTNPSSNAVSTNTVGKLQQNLSIDELLLYNSLCKEIPIQTTNSDFFTCLDDYNKCNEIKPNINVLEFWKSKEAEGNHLANIALKYYQFLVIKRLWNELFLI